METQRWVIRTRSNVQTLPIPLWGGRRRGWVYTTARALTYGTEAAANRAVARCVREGVWRPENVVVTPA